MPKARSAAPAGTRDELLAAAADIFSERGYAAARVRDIASRAGANLAAISYHFGGKQELYLAVLEREAARLIEQHPITRPQHTADPKAALRDVIAGLLGRALAKDERAYVQRLMVSEMLSPSAALPLLVERVQQPQFALVLAVVTVLTGPAVPLQRRQMACLSLIGQCLFYLVARPVVDRVVPGVTDAAGRDALIEHLTAYNLAALHAQRSEFEGASHG